MRGEPYYAKVASSVILLIIGLVLLFVGMKMNLTASVVAAFGGYALRGALIKTKGEDWL